MCKLYIFVVSSKKKFWFLISYGGNRMLFYCLWGVIGDGAAQYLCSFCKQLQYGIVPKRIWLTRLWCMLSVWIFRVFFFAVSSGTGERTAAKQRSFRFTCIRDTLNTTPSDMFYFASFLCQLPEWAVGSAQSWIPTIMTRWVIRRSVHVVSANLSGRLLICFSLRFQKKKNWFQFK